MKRWQLWAAQRSLAHAAEAQAAKALALAARPDLGMLESRSGVIVERVANFWKIGNSGRVPSSAPGYLKRWQLGRLAARIRVMSAVEPLLPGCFYHIYNRGNNRETIFREPENYRFFLERYIHFIEPVAGTYAYCLLPNHFHFLVRTRDAASGRLPKEPRTLPPHIAFKNLFISYSMAFNRRYERTGSLFQKRFKRRRVSGTGYLRRLVIYIHQNPQQHGLVEDFRDWPWSSYTAVVGSAATRVRRAETMGWFGGLSDLRAAHEGEYGDLEALEWW